MVRCHNIREKVKTIIEKKNAIKAIVITTAVIIMLYLINHNLVAQVLIRLVKGTAWDMSKKYIMRVIKFNKLFLQEHQVVSAYKEKGKRKTKIIHTLKNNLKYQLTDHWVINLQKLITSNNSMLFLTKVKSHNNHQVRVKPTLIQDWEACGNL